jgi:hypothetical protein
MVATSYLERPERTNLRISLILSFENAFAIISYEKKWLIKYEENTI